jgi:probable F420-dependent oxidoreductase
MIMQYGIHLFPTAHSIQPGELANCVEERGFESLWFSEHTHIPVKFLDSGEDGPALADYYWQLYDPFIAVSLACSVTQTIKIGTAVSLVIEHNPITLAKQVATVDHISGGRFLFGIGSGWIPEEMGNHGVTYRTRYRLLAEQLTAMKKIWSQDETEFHGEFVNFSKLKSYPKPSQYPHPPILAGGGTGPKSLDLVVNHCDGWMPLLGYPHWPAIKSGIADLRQRCSVIGRDPATIELSIFCWSPPRQSTLEEMAGMGISRLIITLEAGTQAEVLPLLDQYAELINE